MIFFKVCTQPPLTFHQNVVIPPLTPCEDGRWMDTCTYIDSQYNCQYQCQFDVQVSIDFSDVPSKSRSIFLFIIWYTAFGIDFPEIFSILRSLGCSQRRLHWFLCCSPKTPSSFSVQDRSFINICSSWTFPIAIRSRTRWSPQGFLQLVRHLDECSVLVRFRRPPCTSYPKNPPHPSVFKALVQCVVYISVYI